MKKYLILMFVTAINFPTLANQSTENLAGYWTVEKVFTSANNGSSHQVPVALFEKSVLHFGLSVAKLIDVRCSDAYLQFSDSRFSGLPIDDIDKNQSIKSVYGIDIPANELGQLITIKCNKGKDVLLPNDNNTFFSEKAAFLRSNGDLVVSLNRDGVYVARKNNSVNQLKPSFDCLKSKIPTETVICNTPELASLDQRIASNYKEALRGAKKWDEVGKCLKAVRSAHKDWLKKRNLCAADAECVFQAFKVHLQSLADTNLSKWLPQGCPID